MGNGFVWLRSRSTGKTGYYPDFFASWSDFETIDSEQDPEPTIVEDHEIEDYE